MSLIRSKASGLVAAATVALLSVLVGLLLGSAQTAQSSETYAIPAAPTGVKATAEKTGVRVSWTAAPAANPPVTQYVVHAGPGSCPVRVSADRTSALLPYTSGRKSYRPSVQAVNAYGFSPDAPLSRTVVL